MPGIGNNNSLQIPFDPLEKTKKVLMIFWGLLILTGLGAYIFFPSYFTKEAISGFIQQYENQMFWVFAGVIIFPDSPWLVLLISMIGVVAGAAIIYYFTEFLGFEKFFQKRFANKMDRVHRGMERYGIWIVAAWAFFPVVPTDLVAYVAGVVRMKPWKFFLGIIIGELPLVSLYVFGGNAVAEWIL
jgi:uncharacterized membrane protein YdjX (TVP38/TMEM64 family)